MKKEDKVRVDCNGVFSVDEKLYGKLKSAAKQVSITFTSCIIYWMNHQCKDEVPKLLFYSAISDDYETISVFRKFFKGKFEYSYICGHRSKIPAETWSDVAESICLCERYNDKVKQTTIKQEEFRQAMMASIYSTYYSPG